MPRDSQASPERAGATLHARLDVPLPTEIGIGRGTAVFVCGWCFCPGARIHTLEFVLDSDRQPVMAQRMPRLDPFHELHPSGRDEPSIEDPLSLSYRSGFWGLIRVAPSPDRVGDCELHLRATLDGGGTVEVELGRIALVTPPPPPAVASQGDRLVAICMATHNPPADLLVRQLDSIRAQTHSSWICLISDDCSSPQALARIRAATQDDPRFVLSCSPRRLGFYRNFERALHMVPPQAQFVALCDQDDRWHPDKLSTLLDELGPAQLVYSDARIVSRRGAVISETYWSRRRNDHADLASLLFANVVTGAASLFPTQLLDYALPFPPAQFAHYHDHWLGLTALALGDIRFVPRALYDYVQHGGASLGHATANRMPTLADRLGSLRTRSPRERIRKWRMHYFVDVARLMQFATVLEMRCGERMRSDKRRALRRFLASESSPLAFADLVRRGVRELVGRPQTLGAEWMLACALVWRRLLGLSARERPQARLRLDAVPPPDLAPGPERSIGLEGSAVRAIGEKVAPLVLDVRDDAPRRVNVLIPTIDLEHFFGGYITKYNLARRLAQRGVRVRIVTVDPVGLLPRDWRDRIASYTGLSDLFDRVEIEFGRGSGGLEVSRHDAFVATTWWTAHIAHAALDALSGSGFLYLIQEYEPFTFAMGTYAALAAQSYRFDHFALFSSELLRGYFRRHEIGVYERGTEAGDMSSAAFQNAITQVTSPSVEELESRSTRRLLFYARPEAHAARNLFELGVLALQRVLEEGVMRTGWELHGIGTTGDARRIRLAGDVSLELLPRSSQRDYARVLREHDVGLALLLTPHPSLVPIEMASAGLITVTNTFENKTAADLAGISTNLVAGEPTVEGIAGALLEAVAGAEDFGRRVAGGPVRWAREWEESFSDALLERLIAYLDAPALARRP